MKARDDLCMSSLGQRGILTETSLYWGRTNNPWTCVPVRLSKLGSNRDRRPDTRKDDGHCFMKKSKYGSLKIRGSNKRCKKGVAVAPYYRHRFTAYEGMLYVLPRVPKIFPESILYINILSFLPPSVISLFNLDIIFRYLATSMP